MAVCSVTLLLVGSLLRAQSTHCPRVTLPAYAHNDYRNATPLHEALDLGYRGVEVDIFLVDDVLRIGHDRGEATRRGTLEDVYLRPLSSILARCGSLTGDGVPFLLTLDIKERSPETLQALHAVLARYAPLFAVPGGSSARAAGPAVRAVLVGWVPARWRDSSAVRLGAQTRIASTTRRPSVGADEGWTALASLDYGKTIGRWWRRESTRRRWFEALCATKTATPDRWVRAHNVPVDSAIYARLLAHGVDLIGVTALAAGRTALLASTARSRCVTPS